MRRFRFTIASLIGVVLFTAVAFAALREATVLWDSVVFTLTVCVFSAAVLLAVHRVGPARAYWLGFALFGGGYLVATLVPTVEHRLATNRGLAYLAEKIAERSQSAVLDGTLTGSPTGASNSMSFTTAPAGGGFAVATANQGSVQLWNATTGRLLVNLKGTHEEFVRIGHSFVAVLVALAGGGLSRWLHAAGPTRDETSARPDARDA
jgi:hypothetical protein